MTKDNLAREADAFVAESMEAERNGEFLSLPQSIRSMARDIVSQLAEVNPAFAKDDLDFTDLVLGRFSGKAAALAPGIAAAIAPGIAAAIAPGVAAIETGVAGLGSLLEGVGSILGGGEDEEDEESVEVDPASIPTAPLDVEDSTSVDIPVLHFRSTDGKGAGKSWKADLRLPSEPGGRCDIRMRTPRSAAGIFHLCGQDIPVVRGRGEIPLPVLRASMPKGGVSFALPGAEPIAGTPFLEA